MLCAGVYATYIHIWQLPETPRPPHVRHLGGMVLFFACRFIGSAALAAAAPPGLMSPWSLLT
jgi:hypothetical protein